MPNTAACDMQPEVKLTGVKKMQIILTCNFSTTIMHSQATAQSMLAAATGTTPYPHSMNMEPAAATPVLCAHTYNFIFIHQLHTYCMLA
jgi:hypothetical protein